MKNPAGYGTCDYALYNAPQTNPNNAPHFFIILDAYGSRVIPSPLYGERLFENTVLRVICRPDRKKEKAEGSSIRKS
jgi:hypothetical protein